MVYLVRLLWMKFATIRLTLDGFGDMTWVSQETGVLALVRGSMLHRETLVYNSKYEIEEDLVDGRHSVYTLYKVIVYDDDEKAIGHPVCSTRSREGSESILRLLENHARKHSGSLVQTKVAWAVPD
mgnify:CR=1 FL=1